MEVSSNYSPTTDVKIYYLPQSFNTQLSASRKRNFTQTEPHNNYTSECIKRFYFYERCRLNCQLPRRILESSWSYNFDVSSTLAYLTADKDIERSESEIWRDIFGGNLFGKDFNYKQSIDLRTNPKLPSIWDLNRYITINGGYSVNYSWQNNFTQGALGRSAGYTNRITMGFSVRVKSIFAPLFKEESSIPLQVRNNRAGKLVDVVNLVQHLSKMFQNEL